MLKPLPDPLTPEQHEIVMHHIRQMCRTTGQNTITTPIKATQAASAGPIHIRRRDGKPLSPAKYRTVRLTYRIDLTQLTNPPKDQNK